MKEIGTRPKLLMVAYACNPEGIGEYWLGWGWAEQAAKRYEVHLITPPDSRAAVEQHARRCGIQPHFVSPPESAGRWMKLLRGRSEYLRMNLWQRRVAEYAAELHRQVGFFLVHQTTFHSFRVPFRSAQLGIPSVWGPIAGGEEIPPGFHRFLGSANFSERVRQFANRPWLLLPAIRQSLRQASLVFVSNRTSLNFLPARFREKYVVLPPNALRPEDEKLVVRPARKPGSEPFHILYAGWCVATRAVPLVFEAIVHSGLKDFRFSVLGEGPALPFWKQEAARLGLVDRVQFTGKVPYAEAQRYYQEADVLVFPALRDSGGSALLEAMARGLPLICLDWGGPGEMVDEHSGIKIPVTNPAETVRAFGAALVRLQSDLPLRAALVSAARQRAEQKFRWEAKFDFVDSHYQRLAAR